MKYFCLFCDKSVDDCSHLIPESKDDSYHSYNLKLYLLKTVEYWKKYGRR